MSLEHGGEAWAVYVAVASDFDAPEIAAGAGLLEELGYFGGGGDLGCDQGAAEALGLDPSQSWTATAVYFETEEDAQAFVNAYESLGHQAVGYALVQTFCLD
jgi:hypothetical protein